MSVWTIAILAWLPAFALAVVAACRGAAASRLAAYQLALSLASPILIAMTFAFDQSSFIDLPLSVALLSLPGSMILAMFLERWL